MTAKQQRTGLMLAIPGLVMALSGFLMRRDAIEGGHEVGLVMLVAGMAFFAVGVGYVVRAKAVR